MIFVTGASGLVGGNLVRTLLENGRDVRVLVHEDRRALEGVNVETVQGDIRDPEQVARAIDGAEIVYHLAGAISIEMNSWQQMEAINVLGTRNVVKACLYGKVQRLIHFSSIHAFKQEPLDQTLDETRPLVTTESTTGRNNRVPPYDWSKALGEVEIQKGINNGLDAVILAPTAVVGPCDFKPSYFGRALMLMASGKMPALIAGGFDWVDVRDVVAGAIEAERTASCGAKYLLGGHWHSVREVDDLATSMMSKRAPLLTMPKFVAEAAVPFVKLLAQIQGNEPIYTKAALRALHSNQLISHAKATETLGYTTRPFAETIHDTIRWFENNGYLR